MKRTLCVMMVVLTGTAFSQLIPLKTVPLATGEQFLIYPSVNRVMGGVSLALEDSLSDPYHNPATGVLGNGIRLFASPLYYAIGFDRTRSGGSSGNTFPFGMSFRTGDFFGGMIFARQTLSRGNSPGFLGIPTVRHTLFSPNVEEFSNSYTIGTFGFVLPGSSFSAGVSARWSDLNAMEGVQHLYANASDLWQKGSMTEYRIGVRSAWEGGRVLEFLFAHQNTEMKHGYTRHPVFLPWEGGVMPIPRDHVEEDQSTGYSLEVTYRHDVTATLSGGVILAVDLKSYPKIPNYELMNIPRDPGDSRAWNLGFGLANNNGKSVLAIDVIYEPAFSQTWAESEFGLATAGGRMIAAGERTIENDFDFYNHIIRFGIRSAVHDLGMGLSLHRTKYYMSQTDHVLGTKRRLKEQWTEATFSLGFGFDLLGGHVQYVGLFTTGTGRPGVGTPTRGLTGALDWESNFIIAPSSGLTLDEAWTAAHQISFILLLP